MRFLPLLTLVVLILSIWLFLIGIPISTTPIPPLFYTATVFGHNGGGEFAPEDTLGAIWFALLHGAQGIELDIQLALIDDIEGDASELVCIHDPYIHTVTHGTGKVDEVALSVIQSYSATKRLCEQQMQGPWHSHFCLPVTSSECPWPKDVPRVEENTCMYDWKTMLRIPTLREALRFIQFVESHPLIMRPIPVFIEIKLSKYNYRIAQELLSTLKQFDHNFDLKGEEKASIWDRVVVGGFDPRMLYYLRTQEPGLATLLLVHDRVISFACEQYPEQSGNLFCSVSQWIDKLISWVLYPVIRWALGISAVAPHYSSVELSPSGIAFWKSPPIWSNEEQWMYMWGWNPLPLSPEIKTEVKSLFSSARLSFTPKFLPL